MVIAYLCTSFLENKKRIIHSRMALKRGPEQGGYEACILLK